MGILEQEGGSALANKSFGSRGVLALLTICCVIQGKLLCLSGPQFSHLLKWVTETREERLLALAMTTGRPGSRPGLLRVPILLGLQGLHLLQVGFEYQTLLFFFPASGTSRHLGQAQTLGKVTIYVDFEGGGLIHHFSYCVK